MERKEDIKILVVDDEDYMREVVRRALESSGFEVDEAADGKTALAMLRQYPYNVIITDLRMPGLTGETILEEALSLFPETIVIVMTGFGNIQSAVDAIRRGAYDYLPKPFSLPSWLCGWKRASTSSSSNLKIACFAASFRISIIFQIWSAAVPPCRTSIA